MVPVAVADVEMALDPGVVVERTREIAANRHAQGVRAVAGGAEGPAEAGVGPVGDDHVAGPDRPVGAGVLVVDDRAHDLGGPPSDLDQGLDRLGRGPEGGAGLDRPLGDHVVELAAPHHIPVGREVGVVGPGSSSVMPWPIERRPSKRWNSESGSARPMSWSWRTARGVRPSPQVLSRGKRFLSTTTTR